MLISSVPNQKEKAAAEGLGETDQVVPQLSNKVKTASSHSTAAHQ